MSLLCNSTPGALSVHDGSTFFEFNLSLGMASLRSMLKHGNLAGTS